MKNTRYGLAFVSLLSTLLWTISATKSRASDALENPFQVKDGFRVELVYQVPRDQGSWVSLAVDPRGRLMASDQKGGLYRISVANGKTAEVKSMHLPIGQAHGLIFAFDSLYAVVAENAHRGPGLYRIQDTDGDDAYDRVSLLQSFHGTGEHGPHSVIVSPDGESLFVVAGNKTKIPAPALENSLVPTNWGEDDLLPRMWGPIGSEAGTPAPGGWIASTDPEGRNWTLHAIGFRNAFDIAFNHEGELLTVDADAEFDMGTPWYQPTRVFHVVDGTDYGWRSGAGKWPPYYPDTLPPVVEIGPGSPTGVTFGYGTDFPGPYRNCLFVGDWSYGRILAVHLTTVGASYRGTVEEVVSGTPLPVTDMVVHPEDGSIYFLLGGRGTTSGLYRLSWIGDAESREVSKDTRIVDGDFSSQDSSSHSELEIPGIEANSDFDAASGTAPLDDIWQLLKSDERVIRHRARIALERLPIERWQKRALGESDPRSRLMALLALVRTMDAKTLPGVINSLTELNWGQLSYSEQLNLLRVFALALGRHGKELVPGDDSHSVDVEDEYRTQAVTYLKPLFPTGDELLDSELCQLLVYLNAPSATEACVELCESAVTTESQLRYFVPLRHQRNGWTDELRERYFRQLGEASGWGGGLSLAKYVEQIGRDALENVPLHKQAAMEKFLHSAKEELPNEPQVTRPFVRDWKLLELTSLTSKSIRTGNQQRGRKLFAEAQCFACHRFEGQGGVVGPDLTAVARRMNVRDLLEAIVEPNRVISDQFSASSILTADGKVVTGRIVNLAGGALLVQTDMLFPAELERIPETEIEEVRPSKTSMMPSGLLDTFTREEIIDLLAFLTSSKHE